MSKWQVSLAGTDKQKSNQQQDPELAQHSSFEAVTFRISIFNECRIRHIESHGATPDDLKRSFH